MDFKSFSKTIWFPIAFVAVMMTIIGLFSDAIQAQHPYVQFVIIGLPLTFVTLFYFGKLYDGWKFIAGLILVTYAWDLIQPPFMVDFSGTLSSSPLLYGTSIDYVMGLFFSGMGISGTALYYMTYVFGYALLLILASMITSKKINIFKMKAN